MMYCIRTDTCTHTNMLPCITKTGGKFTFSDDVTKRGEGGCIIIVIGVGV